MHQYADGFSLIEWIIKVDFWINRDFAHKEGKSPPIVWVCTQLILHNMRSIIHL